MELLATKFNLINNQYYLDKLYNQESGELYQLPDFLNMKENKTFYVQNLSILHVFLIKHLLNNNYKCYENYKKLKKQSFCYSGKNANITSLFIKNKNNKTIIFVDFKTKFGVEFSDILEENKILLDFAIEHHRESNSLGTDAFNEFLHTFLYANNIKARELMRENYPVLHTPELDECKQYVNGYQYIKKGYYNNIYSYDITSSYPAQLYNNTPIGKPIKFFNLEDIPESYFYVVKFCYFNLQPKQNKINFLDLTNKDGIITLTKELFILMQDTYFFDFSIISINAFKTRSKRFDKFLNKNIKEYKEQQTNKRLRTYNKLFANSIVGYFGRNTIKEYHIIDKTLKEKTINKTIESIYLPLYLYVLGSAKAFFIRTLNKYSNSIIYANTDGFFTTASIDINMLNQSVTDSIGSFKFKGIYKDLYIESINGYAGIFDNGKIDNTISGMTLEQLLTPAQYQQKDFTYYINIITAHYDILRMIVIP